VGPLIAVFSKNLTNPAYANFRLGADRVAQAHGARTTHFVPKRPDDVGEQTELLAAALSSRPDIFLFIPVDDGAMVGPIRKVEAAQIPVVLCINRMAGKFVTFVGSDDVEIGYRAARCLFDAVGRGKVAIIDGIAVAPTSRDRGRGFDRALEDCPAIELVDRQAGNYQRPDACRAMARMLDARPRIDGVVAANDAMALGALDALRAAGRSAPVVGINGVLDAVEQIGAGHMLASVDFSAFDIACVGVEAALRHLAGKPVPERITLPADLIDARNFRKWLIPAGDRPYPVWDDVVR
jgi:ribose transport system substrate-binding protein